MRTLVLIVILLLAPPAMSCGCSAPRSIAEVNKDSMIFKGRVVSVLPMYRKWSEDGETKWETRGYDVTFEVLEPIRRVPGPTVMVSINKEGHTSCDLLPVPVEVGSDWLLSADGNGGLYQNNFCDLRQRLDADTP